MPAVRQSLEELITGAVAAAASRSGYALTAVSFGHALEVTFEKAGAAFVLWLTPISGGEPCYRQTLRFKIGYRGQPPDRLGYALMEVICAEIERWERSQPDDVPARLFDSPPVPQRVGSTAMEPAVQALLTQATFSSIYREWLAVRERQLAAYFESLKTGPKNILLVNATKGQQFYLSIVDFFVLLQRIHAGIRVTAASYFDGIFEFHAGVAAKGLQTVSIADAMAWGAAEINRFDAVILIGPSEVMARIMTLNGVTATLVLFDLGFYHQVLESRPGWYPNADPRKVVTRIYDTPSQINRVTVYSCQPEEKVTPNLDGLFERRLLDWRWFNYIPIGFTYRTYYRSNTHGFDVALLGSNERDYAQIKPDLFRGMRFVFLGSTESAPEIDRLRTQLDVTVVSRVSEDTYAQLLALCRCVAMPASVHVKSVLLSVTDTVATGRPLVTSRHVGLARLERDHVPAVFYDAGPFDLFHQVDELLRDDDRRQDIEDRSIAFAKEKLDIYFALQMILEEQILRARA
jgi:hypothetical protein